MMRTVTEETLRRWKTGGVERVREEHRQNAQIISKHKKITVDTMQGNEKGFPVFMCCYQEQYRVYRGEGCRYESIADKITERFSNRE